MAYRLAKTILIGFALLAAGTAAAHFKLNLNVRILHVEHRPDGLDVYLRLPMPYLVADKLGPIGEDGNPAPAPYTTNAREDGTLVHYLDPKQMRVDGAGLGVIAAAGHPITANGKPLESSVLYVRAYRRGEEPPFATLAEAKTSLSSPAEIPDSPAPYIGDTVTDFLIRYASGTPVYEYEVRSILDPGLPGQEETANLIIDYGAGGTKIYRARGLMKDGVQVSPSAFSAIRTFVDQGIRHILSGTDHVLFILCLILGASRLRGLIERITGFTIGHTITLIAGFFGFGPSGAWFVPAVELGIAITIVYAAYLVVRPSKNGAENTLQMFAITSMIGLLHGLGFSFILHEILKVDSPNLWQSLIAFNVGVEIGQLAIILAIWPVFWLLLHFNVTAWRYARTAVAYTCALVAAIWIFERGALLLAA